MFVNGLDCALHLIDPSNHAPRPFGVGEDTRLAMDDISNVRTATVEFPHPDSQFAVQIERSHLGDADLVVCLYMDGRFIRKVYVEQRTLDDDFMVRYALPQDPTGVPGSKDKEELRLDMVKSGAEHEITVQVALPIKNHNSHNWTHLNAPIDTEDGPVIANFVYKVQCPEPPVIVEKAHVERSMNQSPEKRYRRANVGGGRKELMR